MFEMISHAVVMMNGPPLAPVTIDGLPFVPKTIVGVIADNIRLPGAIAFASPCTSSYWFGDSGFAAKSSISLFRRKPAPVTVAADPNPELIVVVNATALPAASTTEKCVVCGPSWDIPDLPETCDDGVAWSSEIEDCSSRANAFDESRPRSTVTKSGSPSTSLRTANARRMASAWRWIAVAECQPSVARSYASSCCAIIASVTPPDDGGGMLTARRPR